MLFPAFDVLGRQAHATVRQPHASDYGDGPSWGEGLPGSVGRQVEYGGTREEGLEELHLGAPLSERFLLSM